MPANNSFKNINKISINELDPSLQFQISLITGMGEDLGGIYPGATKVENVGGGKIKINDVEFAVYSHPATHPATMITGLSSVALSGNYNDLAGAPTSLPASDVSAWAKAATKPTYNSTEIGAIPASMKGTPNGVAELNDIGKLPIAQLPDNLFDLATNDLLPERQIPAIDITGKLIDNPGTSLVLGGLDSSNLN